MNYSASAEYPPAADKIAIPIFGTVGGKGAAHNLALGGGGVYEAAAANVYARVVDVFGAVALKEEQVARPEVGDFFNLRP